MPARADDRHLPPQCGLVALELDDLDNLAVRDEPHEVAVEPGCATPLAVPGSVGLLSEAIDASDWYRRSLTAHWSWTSTSTAPARRHVPFADDHVRLGSDVRKVDEVVQVVGRQVVPRLTCRAWTASR